MLTAYQTTIVHQSAQAKIEWIGEGKIVRKTFSGFIVGEEMKKPSMPALLALRKTKVVNGYLIIAMSK